MFGKMQNLESQCFEKKKFRIPVFAKGKIKNANVWKSKNLEL